MRRLPLLIYEKPLNPEEVIKRAEVWEKIFKAKDNGEPVEVVINRHVRDDIYEILFEDTVKGLLKSPKKHEIGERVKVKVVLADYTTKKFRTKLYVPEGKIGKFEPGKVFIGKVLKVLPDGGLMVNIQGKKCYVPRNRIGPAIKYPIKDLKKGTVECLILRVDGKKVICEILKVRP
ncbi:MAG: hypothetical protein ABIL16_03055 [candidate division WOR-3 bacterium]